MESLVKDVIWVPGSSIHGRRMISCWGVNDFFFGGGGGGGLGQRWQYPTKIFKLHFLSSKTSQLGGCNEPFSR